MKEFKDIRINKKNFKNSIMDLSFFKINFMFFSNILKKYKGNEYVESLISQQIPLIFLIKSDNNESILKSVSDILELLKRKREEKKSEEAKSESPDLNIDKNTENISKFYTKNIQNKIINNEYHPTDLTYNYEKKDDRILQVLESIVVNIKKNLKLSKKSDTPSEQKLNKNHKKSNQKEESPQKLKVLEKSSKLTNKPKKIKIKKEDKPKKQKSDNLEESLVKKDELEEDQQVLKTLSLKKITSQFEKINEKIIKRNIQKAKISKINYDFIFKDRVLNKNIYNKVNNTIFSIINKNNKVKHFSEVSKSMVLLNKKFKTNNIIKELQDIITKNKTKQKHTQSNTSRSKFSQKSIFKNDLFHKNEVEHKNLLTSLASFYSDIFKRSIDSLSFKNKITKNKLLNKYEKINLLKKNNYIFDLNKKIKKQNIFDLNDEFIENSITKNDLFYKNNFEHENLFKTLASFYSDISKRSVDSLSFKNKITKNKLLNKYEKINLLKKNNYIFDLNKKIKKQNAFDLNDEFIENSMTKNYLFYKNNFERENLFKTLTSFYSDIFKRSIDSLSYKNKITKNKFLNKYEKTNLLKKNNYIFDLNKRIKKQNIFDLNDEFVENSIITNDLLYKNNFERENLFKTLTSFYSDISKCSIDSLSFKNKITKNKLLNKYEKTNLLKKNNYIFDLNKKIKKQNIFDLNDEFIENSIIKNDLFYKNNFERENLFKTLVSFYSDISKRSVDSLSFKNKIVKKLKIFFQEKQSKYLDKNNLISLNNIVNKINKSKILFNRFKTQSNYSELNLNTENLIETEKNVKTHEDLFYNSHFVYRTKGNIEKMVENIVDKRYKEKNDKNLGKKPKKEYYNDSNFEILKNVQKQSKPQAAPGVTKDEVNKIVKSYVESIDLKKVSDNAVLEVSNRINLERYRNGII